MNCKNAEKKRIRFESQKILLDSLNDPQAKLIENLLLESANLVCGTTIGILLHPKVKQHQGDAVTPIFDVLIIDNIGMLSNLYQY